ncbi:MULTISPECIES: hypothetical protein [Acinetobacter]|uniref:Uncharacterized protein n=1 Tax=Acinetobacter higginsii TaxID=70347 RepID=N9T2H2_9GAMM|nr:MULTISPECIES: hypothetical protein [Acinetobacter]ENX55065.1 hypothetical protein F902_03675 [Acinetobacter higginsii]ENX61306.1 hypothetical protein F885_01706 [Acinetobacter higginsii]MCH7303219.1 hypothetical protein [Acinetobacter higginsii]MCH7318795.1 hypothetical protein [Acinetobacter higginsii]MCH7338078.1 hypothetical protein [Acinetobacter higginsii]
MTRSTSTVLFKRTVLASFISLCVSQSIFALQEISDDALSETTGEGIAFLPEGFSMRMNGADDVKDTGYLRLIPIGPLQGNKRTGTPGNYTYTPNYTYNTTDGEVYDANGAVIRKADIFLYGLNLSQSNVAWGAGRTSANWDMSFGRPINSWGTANNPWIFQTNTDKVQQFNDTATGRDVTYFNFEAPLYKTLTSANNYNDINALTDAEKSAYNLRLSLWGDAFMRDANIAEGTKIADAYNGLSNQLRFNMVWDGFSVNGSNFKMFRTLDGVIGGNTTAQAGLSKAYNNTLGMAATLRLNSMPTQGSDYRAIVDTTTTRTWQTYDASSIGFKANAFTATELAQLKAGNFSSIGGTNKVVISDGTGNVPVGTVMWNGPVSLTTPGTNNPSVINVANPADNLVIKSYVPLGNSQGNATVDDASPRLVRGTGANRIWENYRIYKQSDGSSAWSIKAICGAAAGNTGQSSTTSSNNPGQCVTQEGFRVVTAKASSTNSWKLPDSAKKSMLRINAETVLNAAGNDYVTNTPALGGSAPSFDSSKGLFIYGLNANIVLGTLYQPVIFDAKGGNFSIEVTRIPNDVDVYSKIYTRYDFDNGLNGATIPDSGVSYLGSTCNIYRCSGANSGNPNNISLGGVNYQTSGATHSSITIGSTNYDATKNLLSAYNGVDAFGISFGELQDATNLTSENQIDYIQTLQRRRCASSNCASGNWNPSGTGAWQNWTQTSKTNFTQNTNSQIVGRQTNVPTTFPSSLSSAQTVANNMGSAVIDGLLIQHLKLTTTGIN